MVREQKGKGYIEGLFMFGLLMLFTISSLILVAIGANVYKGISSRIDDRYNDNMALSYVVNKVRSSDSIGAVDVKEIAGRSTLIISHQFESGNYSTYIFSDGGDLYELFIEDGREIDLLMATRIASNTDFKFLLERDNLIRVESTGEDLGTVINLRT